MSGFAISSLVDDDQGRVFGYYQDASGSIQERLLQGSTNWTLAASTGLVASSNSAKSNTPLATTSLLFSNTLWVSLGWHEAWRNANVEHRESCSSSAHQAKS